MKKITLKNILEEPNDIRYEYIRAIKTFCIIMIVFCIGFINKMEYHELIANSRFLKYYPEQTLFYQDYLDASDFSKIKLPEQYKKLSYGIFKDERGKDKFLIVATTDKENSPIIDKKKYSYFIKNRTVFISNSNEALLNVQDCLNTRQYAFLKNKNIKRTVKTLDKTRDYTIIISNPNYANLKTNADTDKAIDIIFDKAIIQIFKDGDNLKFNGEISFENDLAGYALNFKKLTEGFSNRKIKVSNFKKDKVAMIIGVKDFDLWSMSLLNIAKTLPKNQYSLTLNFIEDIFNSDVENDIIKKLNGNAVFYLFNEKRDLHPMLLLETKQDIASQAKKYFGFLQLTNGLKVSPQEVNKKAFNILTSKFYPYNLSFGTIDNSLFLLGHQNIIEKFTETENQKITTYDGDFYFFTNINKTPVLRKNKGFWHGYNTMEVQLKLTPQVTFSGEMIK